ncbi:MAG TPA: GntR family transcriptional regulator [Candidatus Limnocylindria bacterium]|jgi:DNA-binding GntR family transcriptional regulator|nr:GntR family transcriptional regulator [Candidatus Limnocylindria bacterium]
MTETKEGFAPFADQRVLADRIYEAIKDAILSLQIPPGSPLVERNLAQRFAVSKSPVRDALQRLAGEGLVEVFPHRGMVVRTFDARYVDELYELRIALEELAVRFATPRFTASDVEEARRILDLAKAAMERGDPVEVARLNQRFHLLFSERSGNRPLHDTLVTLQDRVRLIGVVGWTHGAPMDVEHEEHLSLLQAVAEGRAEDAVSLLRRHIDGFRQAFRAAFMEM